MSDNRVPTEQIALAFARGRGIPRMRSEERFGRLIDLIHDFAEHSSIRCGRSYGQWRDGDCPCGLTEALRDAGLPVSWAGGPPVDDAETAT